MEVKACEKCRWWEREKNPLRHDWGWCLLAIKPGGDFQALIVISEDWTENSPALHTRSNFYCAKFEPRA